jgi:hypothetical protein
VIRSGQTTPFQDSMERAFSPLSVIGDINPGLLPGLVSERASGALHADLNPVLRAEGPIHTGLAQRARHRSGQTPEG